MKGNWDTYFCRVDDKPAQILLDLDLMRRAPLPEYPVLGYVSISMQDPDADGFPLQEEYELLSGIEEFLVDLFTAGGSSVYVGSCTTDGRYDLYFYMRYLGGWTESLENAMQDYEDVDWEAGIQEDPEWTSYRAFLFPDDHAMLEIQNRRVLEQLKDIGDDTARSRMIDHWAGFPSRENALAFAEKVRDHGFIISGQDANCVTYFPPAPASGTQDSGTRAQAAGPASPANPANPASPASPASPADKLGSGEADSAATAGLEAQEAADIADILADDFPEEAVRPETAYRVQFSRPDPPDEIDEVSFPLAELAQDNGGVYLGWATPMMK